jgi:hypothetical protein
MLTPRLSTSSWIIASLLAVAPPQGLEAAALDFDRTPQKDLLGVPVEPQEVYRLRGTELFDPHERVTIVVGPNRGDAEFVAVAAEQIADWFRIRHVRAQVIDGKQWDGSGPAIVIGTNDNLPKHLNDATWLAVQQVLPSCRSEGYRLLAHRSLVVVAGSDPRGAFYGAQCILQLLDRRSNLPPLVLRDWPEFPFRAAMMFRKPESEARFQELALYRYNAILFDTSDWYRLQNVGRRTNIENWMALCKKYGMEPIPHIRMSGHAQMILKEAPECAEGLTAVERVMLSDLQWTALECRNVLDLPNSHITVKDAAKGQTYRRDVDFEVKKGVLRYGYDARNEPWTIRRLSSGGIHADQLVEIEYGYVQPDSESTCPYEPKTREIATRAVRQAMELVKPRFIHLTHDEIRVLGHDPRCRAVGSSNAKLLADNVVYFRDVVKQINSSCTLMIWADTVDRLQHAGGLQTQDAINLLPKDVVLCHWWYLDGWEEWMRANMEHSTRRDYSSVGTVWYQRQNAAEWLKVLGEKHRWEGKAIGIILAPWPDAPGDAWPNLQLVGSQAWCARALPATPKPIPFHITQWPVTPRKESGATRLLPINETFDSLDDRELPPGWNMEYTPNAATSKRHFGASGKSFEVSGDRLVGRGARLLFDDTYCYGAVHLGQELWIDSATAGEQFTCKRIELHGPGFAPRAMLKIVGRDSRLAHSMMNDKIPASIESVQTNDSFVPNDQWVHLDIVVDLDAMHWHCWVNGKQAFSGAPFAASEHSLAGIQWTSRTDGKVYNGFWLDNVQIDHYQSMSDLKRAVKLPNL